MAELSTGAIQQIFDNPDSVSEVILQILSVKRIAPATNSAQSERFRLVLSDGVHFMQSMLATQLNYLINDAYIDKNSFIKMKSHVVNLIQTRKILICLDVEVVAPGTEKVGEPTSVEGENVAASNKNSTPSVDAQGDTQMTDASSSKPAPAAPVRNPVASRANPPKTGGVGSAPVYPIEGLSPYQNKWTIKARVTQKSEIRHWSNQKGEGKLFNVTLMDETGEIRATGFNDVVDNLYNKLEEGKVYLISKARVNIAKKQFSNVNNEYEIGLEGQTEVVPCDDADSSVPQVKFNFKDLGSLGDVEKDTTCDILGIIKEVGELGSITGKASQRQISKRDLTIVDKSGYSVRMTLWGKVAENFSAPDEPVVAFKAVKVGDFGGRSLSMISSSTMINNPDIPEAHDLRGWYDNTGNTAAFTAHSSTSVGGSGNAFKQSEYKSLDQVVQENLGQNDQPDYYNTRATVIYVKQDSMSYPACPTERCNKKLFMENDDSWRCERCDRTFPAPDYRYVISLNVSDYSGQIWLSGFNEAGVAILGHTADEMEKLKSDDDPRFRKIMAGALGKTWQIACRAKSDTFNDVTRVRHSITKITPVDFVAAGKALVEAIAAWGIA